MKEGSVWENPEYYRKLVAFIRHLYKGDISDHEAHEAAHNLINFSEFLSELEEKQALKEDT